MDKIKIEKILQDSEALLEGHFLLTSGRHAGRYVQCAQVLQYPEYTKTLAQAIAEKWVEQRPEVVIGPALGGIVLAYAVGAELNTRAIFSERKEGKQKIRRNFVINPGEKVLIVEDVVTTGSSVQELVDLVEEKDGNIIGISSIVDRSGGTIEFAYPFYPLLELEIPSYFPSECPICQDEGIPPVKPGSRE
ncbi:MAG: orotate phosphoribosyltransferase [Bacillota bacterium]